MSVSNLDSTKNKPLDVITIGRSSVDLYGAQVGGRLEDMASFQKYIGGSPTNIAAGAARLGLRSALVTRVGDEHMGRFIREELAREGVDIRGVKTDPNRLTALVILGIRDDRQFPLIFYRENCADMALEDADIDPAFIAEARSVVATGTHLSHPKTESAVLKALHLARGNGARTALDIDYRPNLWGLSGHGDGENRFIESARVTARLQQHLGLFDLIVGTEEEFHIAGGSTDTITALKAVRALTAATLICKRGPMGASAFTSAIPASLDEGQSGPGFPVEVFNVLGAGDGFMAGLLKGWLDNAPWPLALTYANACGAFAVSRHGCAPSYPSWDELQLFLKRGVVIPALRHDRVLEQVHWATNRHKSWPVLRVFAFDHRSQFEAMEGYSLERVETFKALCLQAVERVAQGRTGYGLLCDNRLGRPALHRAVGKRLWIGRPAELPGSRPLKLEAELGPDAGGLNEWPVDHVVKLLCACHPDDDAALWAEQEAVVERVFLSARRNRLEFLLEIVASKHGPNLDETIAQVLERFYRRGIFPDWWKLKPMASDAAWEKASAVINKYDPHCRGILMLGLDATEAELSAQFTLAAGHDIVKGFAIGRTIFGASARAWLKNEISDDEAVARMSSNFERLCEAWDSALAAKGRPS